MSNNLYPLTYKPGIQRDGTSFQADYCTDGTWVRFQRGVIKKMGGMKAVGSNNQIQDLFVPTHLRVVPTTEDDDLMIIYLGSADGTVKRFILTQDFDLVGASTEVFNGGDLAPNIVWQSELVIQNNRQRIVFLGAPILRNINNTAQSILLIGNITNQNDGNNFNLLPFVTPPNLSGLTGLLYVSPYLFVYGSNGLLQWSTAEDTTSFPKDDKHSIEISNDKIIYGRAIRGGVNTPTILFWTLTSVIRCINTAPATLDLDFQLDVLSRSSSIMSSRCVVEYDGVFIWPGTNRFFHYNGVVDELSNVMNYNFFFNNIDMNYRQKVFGVKNTLYGEIWWFYPEKGQDIGDGIVNTRAIIYNIRDNSWYDTPISREAGVYSEEFGFMASYGRSLTTPLGVPTSLYRHEYETFRREDNSITEQTPNNDNNGTVEVNPIVSDITTPVISWAAFNPMKQLTGVDRWMYLITIEPDFILTRPENDMVVIINSKEYAQNFPISSTPYPISGLLQVPHDPQRDKVDTAIQGRHLTLTFRSTDNFEMGHIMLCLGIGDGQ